MRAQSQYFLVFCSLSQNIDPLRLYAATQLYQQQYKAPIRYKQVVDVFRGVAQHGRNKGGSGVQQAVQHGDDALIY